MPSTPTTKSQVQAYRFVLRRMESALVRKDPVMLHDPMRSHKRATIVGAILGVVGLVGFLLFGVLKPAPTVPSEGIIIAQPSGSVYVVDQGRHELIPVFNVVSGRLLLAAGQQQQQGGQDSGSQSAGQPANVTTVNDDELSSYAVGQMTGIPDGPTALPKPNQPATPWAVCDAITPDHNAKDPTGHKAPSTAVLVGLRDIGTNLKPGQALLVSSDSGRTLWLVYGLASDINHPNDSAVRAQLDTSAPVLSALNVNSSSYRVVSSAVLNAIPSVAEITDPTTGLGQGQVPAPLASFGLQVGQSFAVNQADGGQRFYIVVPGGAQQVSETTAQIAMYENSNGLRKIPAVPPQDTNSLQYLTNSLKVDVTEYPGALPTVISADSRPVMCLGWQADYSNPQQPLARTRVTTDLALEVPPDAKNPTGHMAMVPVGTGTPTGRINQFFMNPTLGGVAVRAATGSGEFDSGPIYVVDPRGVSFSVPDTFTAQVLGIANGTATGGLPPAPQAILGLLPPGGSPLSMQAVQHAVDGMAVPSVGHFLPPPSQQQQAQGGG
ncbi:MAG TPA: type VII secretion protein EccB [Pseudonocardiaceae bacterium]|nr:type VII secretion protein EccB [Pseudonocardiaceae bacterium]